MTWMPDPKSEWLETDGSGGYAMGTVSGRRTRRYHGVLVAATTPPTGRMMLVNGFDAFVDCEGESIPLSTQLYPPYVVSPDNTRWLDEFSTHPWPTWQYRLPNGLRIQQELFMPRGETATVLRWRCLDECHSTLRLRVRPFLSGRDHHGTHHENGAFQFQAATAPGSWCWAPYANLPPIVAFTNGDFHEEPLWYRQFLYEWERERGLDDLEDLASPGEWNWNLAREEAVLVWSANRDLLETGTQRETPVELVQRFAGAEASRRSRQSVAERVSEAYIVRGSERVTVVAGYPWFTDWGRDTFISLRGLCLATGQLEVAGDILDAWSGLVSEGMLPNRFPDHADEAEFNSVDASLWYVLVVHEYLEICRKTGFSVANDRIKRLTRTVAQILSGYARGTRYGIHLDSDGLIAAGEPGVQLTWMDAKVGDWVVTPRIGKPVEIQALWLNALAAFPELIPESSEWLARGLQSFGERFWNEELGCLVDVVDPDHRAGRVDAAIRPNQIFALGGLPMTLVDPDRARSALRIVEEHLLTPLGLRTLSPSSADYVGRYRGDVRSRDGAYHQGTVWPWLLGPFVEAWLKTNGDSLELRRTARERFLVPLNRHRKEAGLDHLSEIADGDAPHSPKGCPFQAWSVAEWLRLDLSILKTELNSPPEPTIPPVGRATQ